MSRLSSKRQVTIPVRVLREAGLAAGDEVVIRASAPGRIELERADDLIDRYAGCLPAGTYPPCASVYAEVMVRPLRQGTDARVDGFLDATATRVVAVDRSLAGRAAQLRGRYRSLRLDDALSASAAAGGYRPGRARIHLARASAGMGSRPERSRGSSPGHQTYKC